MRSKLRFFDGKQSSRYGTLRGLVAFPFCLAAVVLFAKFVGKQVWELKAVEKWTRLIFAALVLCSAVGVQDDRDLRRVAVYSLLVFVVVFGATTSLAVTSLSAQQALLVAACVALGPLAGLAATAAFPFPQP